ADGRGRAGRFRGSHRDVPQSQHARGLPPAPRMSRRSLELRSLRGLFLCGLVAGAALALVMPAWELGKRGAPAEAEAPPEDLRRRGLDFPVAGVSRTLTDSFDDPRGLVPPPHPVGSPAPRGAP